MLTPEERLGAGTLGLKTAQTVGSQEPPSWVLAVYLFIYFNFEMLLLLQRCSGLDKK